ncbi:glycosyltransferase family 4 protein [Nitrosopumilus sp.]|uniref:glycosyltransferase family 4 protein n=1 Tax=Nitrosopumilus sp. TaxID=2024843 RepID=UPI00247C2227|nr:glycosyltransferase family 4 protein [Nitrosopumilus sp.]MCV0430368.1 glycosyltransferase family 4 protein [Nitrosopumilus sp.]
MRILVMVFHFPPMSGGGVVVIVDIINKLAELGNDVTVITPQIDWNGEIYQPKLNSKIKVIRTDSPSKSKIKVAARRCHTNMIKEATKIGKNQKFDFIFSIFHPFHLAPKAAVETAKKLEIPSIVKIDDAIYDKATGLKSIQRKIEKILNAKTLKNSSKVLVANEETKNIVISEYGILEKNISILPNGVNLNLFSHVNNYEVKKIVFTGAMYYHRGLDILLNALPKIIEKHNDVKLVLMGSGPELEKLKEIVKQKKIESNVEFVGWIERKDIPEKLKDAILGIGPLRLTDVTSGALPIKVLEYMAASLPIIAQKNTLPNDVLVNEKNGFFIDGEDDLVMKINQLLNNTEQMITMGKESEKMVRKFSWDNVVNEILEIARKN